MILESNIPYRLGDLIEEISIKNENVGDHILLGVNLEKELINSVANTIDTDMSGYKILKKNQFVCKLMSVGRDEALPIAYNENYEIALVSSAYYVFKNKRPDLVLDEYLMSFFSKSDFGRKLWFLASGDVRGGVNWEQFCNSEIHLPDINNQMKITKTLKLLKSQKQLLLKKNVYLEKIAQCNYIKLLKSFEEFQEVQLSNLVQISAGGDNPSDSSEEKTDDCNIPIYSNGSKDEGLFGYTKKARILKPSITISARGYLGYTVIRYNPYTPIVRLISLTPLDSVYLEYLYFYFKDMKYADNGTAQQQVTVPYFKNLKVRLPKYEELKTFHDISLSIFMMIESNKKEIEKLDKLSIVLSSKFII